MRRNPVRNLGQNTIFICGCFLYTHYIQSNTSLSTHSGSGRVAEEEEPKIQEGDEKTFLSGSASQNIYEEVEEKQTQKWTK